MTRTSYRGAGHFLAGEGILVFAADRSGLAEGYERVWLRPSAARRLAGFLDLRAPGVVGYRVLLDPNAAPTLHDAGPPIQRLADALARMDEIGGGKHLRVVKSLSEAGGAWPLHATLSYHHRFKLAGGQWSVDQPLIALRAQENEAEVLLAACISRPEDVVQVKRAADAIEKASEGLVLEEVALSEDATERHVELRRALSALGPPDHLRIGNIQTRERERRETDATSLDEWTASNEAASYRMRPHRLDTMMKRVEDVDDASIGGLIVYLPSDQGTFLALDLRQSPGRDDHLLVQWHGARTTDATGPVTKEIWSETGQPVDWDDATKLRHVLACWSTAAIALMATSPETDSASRDVA